MDDALPARAILWREGTRSFRRHINEWWKPAAVFFVLLSIFGFIVAIYVADTLAHETAGIKATPAANADGAPKEAEMPKPEVILDQSVKMPPTKMLPLFGASIGLWVVLLVEYFYFTVLFARKEMKVGKPELTVGRFFYAFAKAIQVTLVFIGVSFCFAIVEFGVEHALGAKSHEAKIATGILELIRSAVTYYLGIRWCLVYVLATNRVRPVLTNSWRLTDDNFWRLAWNGIVLAFITAMFFIAAVILAVGVAWALRNASGATPMAEADLICMAVAAAFGLTLFMGVFSAYRCVACRILLDEKLQKDSSFLMTNQA